MNRFPNLVGMQLVVRDFAASIGDNEALVSTQAIFAAMPPDHHPASGQTLDLEMVGCAFRDNEPAFWAFHRENLRRQFDAKVRSRVERQVIRHLSVFALAPQPLLIEVGRLLCDIVPATIRQRHLNQRLGVGRRTSRKCRLRYPNRTTRQPAPWL